MAYRQPYFIFLHAARTAGLSGVSSSPAAHADFPIHYAIDGRGQSLFKFASSGANSTFTINRGTAGLTAVDTLLIPSGHNLGAQTVTVKASATGAYGGEETEIGSFTSAAGLIEETLTSSTAQYQRITFEGTGQWELPEVWLGQKRTPASGPSMRWVRRRYPNIDGYEAASGVTGKSQQGLTRRGYSLAWERITGADVALFNDFFSEIADGLKTFYFAGPDDSDPTMLCELLASGPIDLSQDRRNATVDGPRYSYRAELIEALG